MRADRAIVLVLAVAGFVAAAALLVREVALQAAGTLVWTTPRWWSQAVGSGGWGAGGVAGVAALLVAAVLFALAVGVALPQRGSQEAHVQIGSPGSRASVRRADLEEMIGRALAEEPIP